jgi:hypothetical protein
MINDDLRVDTRTNRIMSLLHIIAAVDPRSSARVDAAGEAFLDLCAEVGEDAAWTLVARLPSEALLTLATIPARAA